MKSTAFINLAVLVMVFLILDKLKVFDLAGFIGDLFGGGGQRRLPPVVDPQVEEKDRVEAQMKPTLAQWIPVVENQIDNLVAANLIQASNKFIVLSIIWQESLGVPNSTGAAGEIGLGHISQEAARDIDANYGTTFGYASFDPVINIQQIILFWELQFQRMGQDSFEATRAYNCGAFGATRYSECGKTYADRVFKNAVIIKERFF